MDSILCKNIFFGCIFVVLILDKSLLTQHTKEILSRKYAYQKHIEIVNAYFKYRKKMLTSNLGTILYKNVDPLTFANPVRESRTYDVMLWSFWTEFVSTYLRTDIYDSDIVTQEILHNCRVKNCRYFSSYSKDIESTDVVIFSTHQRTISTFPKRKKGSRWILWNHGSPKHKTLRWSGNSLKKMSGIFNWTMGYRSNSDIPIPYGRTVALRTPVEVDFRNLGSALLQLVPYWLKKQGNDVLVTILADNCNSRYFSSLSEEMDVDIFWKSCPKDWKTDCVLPEKYLFYFAFEESSCIEYITEAVFHHAYSKGAIPVISGPPLEDCKKLLPPNSFLHVKLHRNIPELVKHMKKIAGDYATLLTYHSWRQHFEVVNEHGFFNTTSYQLCRVCEALNYNDEKPKIYDSDDLQLFYNDKLFCNITYKCE